MTPPNGTAESMYALADWKGSEDPMGRLALAIAGCADDTICGVPIDGGGICREAPGHEGCEDDD